MRINGIYALMIQSKSCRSYSVVHHKSAKTGRVVESYLLSKHINFIVIPLARIVMPVKHKSQFKHWKHSWTIPKIIEKNKTVTKRDLIICHLHTQCYIAIFRVCWWNKQCLEFSTTVFQT